MDRPMISENSSHWMAFVWISFVASNLATAIGIYNLPVDFWVKGYMSMGLLFCVGSCFTLSKTVRDNHEARKLINRVSEAKTERMLHDFELKATA
ncbi:MAG: YiaA/YiaB family inner membrane protein [Candidatus Obscuribacterales bacterium]